MAKMTNAVRESLALNLSGQGASISLHTGDPGTTGAAEASGTTRQTTTWTGGGSDGSVSGSEVAFAVGAGTYTHIGCWTGSTFLWSQSITSVSLTGPGQVLVTPTISVPQGT